MKTKLMRPWQNPMRRWLIASTLATSLIGSGVTQAATGTWNIDGGGLWSTAGNWSGTVPAAAGDTANFTYAISAPNVITNDVSRTLAILNIADNLGDPGYTLTNNSGVTLTLNNLGAGAKINQTGGASANDVIGTPLVLADNLTVAANAQLTFARPISGSGFGLTVGGAGTVMNTAADTFTGPVVVNGGTLTFGPGGSINNAASLTINNGGTAQFSGAANGNPIGTGNMAITVNAGGTLAVTVNNAMGYSDEPNYANLTLNGGTLSLSAVQYIHRLQLNGGTVNGTAALQYWYPVSMAINCSNSASIASPIKFNNTSQTISVAAGATLTVSGAINSDGANGFTKTGPGLLVLAGANTYTGVTTVSNGVLQVDGTVSTGAVAVKAGGTLTGTGSFLGTVTVQTGGVLTPGDSGIGSISPYTLALAAGSTNVMKISKTGGTLNSDALQGMSSATFGGTLVVSNITSDGTALAGGDTFQLFSAGSYSGGFTALVLPSLPAGLSWDASQLTTSGTLAVSSATGTPVFTPAAGSYPGPQVVTISSLTPGATIYYTTDGSTPTTSSPHGVTPVTVTVLGTSPSETLTAYAALTGHTDSGVNSANYTLSTATWNNVAGGNWSDSASWKYNTVGNGSGVIADFSALTLTKDTGIVNDYGPTLGGMIFADRGNSHRWSVSDNGGGQITLDNGANAPVIAVSNQTATITTSLAGTSGLTKTGAGALTLAGANTYTGTTTVGGGTLNLATTTDTSAGSPVAISAGATVTSSATLRLDANQNGGAPSVNISGDGTLRLAATTNSAASPDLYFAPDQVNNNFYGAIENAALDLGAEQRFVYGLTGHNGVGRYGLVNADCVFGGSISGAGGLTFIAQNNWTDSNPMEVPFCLMASNSFAGPVEIQRGSVYLANANALTQTNVLFLNANSGNSARLFLYGNSVAVANLSSSSTGTNVIANGNELTGAALTLAAATLAVNQSAPGTYSGSIQDVQAEYDGSGSGTTGPLGLTKAGASTLTLSGVNTYSGATVINQGTLMVNGSLGASAVTVQTNGTLSGTGVIGGTVTVNGTLKPGAGDTGTLTCNGDLTLNAGATSTFAVNGSTLAGNSVALGGAAIYAGTLNIVPSGTFSAGQSFSLFTGAGAASASNFAGITGTPGTGLSFTFTNGILSVVSGSVSPVVLTNKISGSVLTLSWPAGQGWRLVGQTNSLSVGLKPNPTAWGTVSGVSDGAATIMVSPTNPAVFYRLVNP